MDSENKKEIVKDFLIRCIEYADETIARKTESDDDPEGLAKWIAYREYTEYAVKEIDGGDLNHWF
tara:strand:+ start:1558 stop:1752 length:195 start_codon:yes stop_codon:yes gene_type:complete